VLIASAKIVHSMLVFHLSPQSVHLDGHFLHFHGHGRFDRNTFFPIFVIEKRKHNVSQAIEMRKKKVNEDRRRTRKRRCEKEK
jgi:hypothetical protein